MKSSMNNNQTQRRAFLKKLGLGVGATSFMAMQGKMQLIQSAIAADSNYNHLTDHKTLVCVFLYGGNDAFNTLIPYEQAAYQQYARDRRTMAIARDTLLPLKGNQYAFHPALDKLQPLYDSGKLGIAANVGALIEPTTKQAYLNKAVKLPADLFSHSHQQEFWQSGASAKGSIHPPGWGGRMMDMLISANRDPQKAAMFSIAENSIWQRGLKPLDFVLNMHTGVNQLEAFANTDWPLWTNSRIAAWNKIKKIHNSSLLNQQLGKTFEAKEKRIAGLVGDLTGAQSISTAFNDDPLSLQLKMAAKMISVRQQLGMKRQIIFVALGGWDTHANQLKAHTGNLNMLNSALASFYQSTVDLGVADSVTTFTASEFGRTYSTNGDGTDHAWAGHNMILGGAVKGGKIHGDMPDFIVNGPTDSDTTGRFIPKYSVDQYGATLAKWMGMSDSDMHEIFPNLKNFTRKDLGFMV